MQPAKSLRKLRSATTAYLEDGSAMIHNIDALLRDARHALKELESREQSIVLKEQLLQQRESRLEALTDRVDAALQQLLLGTPDQTADNSSRCQSTQTSELMSVGSDDHCPAVDLAADCNPNESLEQPIQRTNEDGKDSTSSNGAIDSKPLPSVNRSLSKRQKSRRRSLR